ncbi:MAG: thioredoxin-disulfide reductase [bacterium]
MKRENYDFVSLGAGPAGLTAVLYASRAGMTTLAVDHGPPGGQLHNTEQVDNYPGFPEGVAGPRLADLMLKQAERFGAEVAYGEVEGIGERGEDGYLMVRVGGEAVRAGTVLIATGALPGKIGIPGEEEFAGKGVSYCAICDGAFFRGREVCVVGGGDSAVEEAVYLSKLCSKVKVVHRRDELRARRVARDAAFGTKNIEFVWSHVPIEIRGGDAVEALVVRSVKTGGETAIPCGGVFIYVGFVPNTGFVDPEKIRLNEQGFVITGGDMQTSMPGVFAAGDVRRISNRQIITACADGSEAVLSAERYMQERGR